MRLSVFSLLLVACAPSVSQDAVVDRHDLSNVFDGDAELVGVTLTDDGPVVLDAWQGIRDLDGAVIGDADALSPGWDARPFTDIAALDDGAFAVTVPRDGLRFEPGVGTEQYFCYEPGFMEPVATQLTDSVAFDPLRREIVAQPQTSEEGTPTDASVATYGIDGGQPREWYSLPNRKFRAGAMAVDGEEGVLLARGGELLSYGWGDDAPQLLIDVSKVAERVEGMALTDDGGLWLLDAANQELVLLEDWRPE